LELVLSNDWQTADRDQINKARRAAEDLFRPKQPTEHTAPVQVSTDAPASGEAPAASDTPAPRKPRIIAIPAIVPMRNYTIEPPAPEPVPAAPVVHREPKPAKAAAKKRVPKIPAALHGRIPALASYGMTPAEVAAVYGVAEAEIERIIAKA
jgi:hypothetical protein